MFIASGALTMRDIAARLDKSGEKFDSTAIDLVAQSKPLIGAMPMKEANDGTSNKTTLKVALPDTAEFKGYGEGVKPSKGGVTHVRNTAAHMDAVIEISQREYDEAPDVAAFLKDHASDVVENMSQLQAKTLIYGSIADNPRAYNGFFAHQKAAGITIGGSNGARWTPNGSHAYDEKHPEFYLFDFGGNFTLSDFTSNGEAKTLTPVAPGSHTDGSLANMRSIGLIALGPKTVSGFYPRGTNGGIKKGEFKQHETLIDKDGGKYEGCIQFLSWDFGLDIRDWRGVCWGRNIDVAALEKRGCEYFIIEMLRKMSSRLCAGNLQGGKRVWTMSLPMWEAIQSVYFRATMGNAIGQADFEKFMVPTLFNTPVLIEDCMNIAEPVLPKAA